VSAVLPIAVLITPVLPLPGGSGRALRAWDWLCELSRDHAVHVLVAAPASTVPAPPPHYPAADVRALGEVTRVTARYRRLLGLLFPPAALISRRFVLDWQVPAQGFAEAAGRGLVWPAVRRIVVFRLYLRDLGVFLSRYCPTVELELDLDDLESHTRLSVAASLLRGRRYRAAARMLASAAQYWLVEQGVGRRCRTLYLAAPEDCRHLSRRTSADVACRPNRIRMPADVAPPPRPGELRLLFVGTLDYPPNEEAARDLAQRLVPILRARLERPWRLVVVGSHAAPALAGLLRRTAEIEFIAEAADLPGLYTASHVVLVPVRAGGGTKFKTLEGFAYRRPVVSTRHGVRGLAARPGEHYLPAETAAEFAAAIHRLAGHPPLAERIAEAGRRLCYSEYRVP